MIVIADSGSTKCDWIITNGQEEIRTKTQGFNPMFHSSQLIEDKLRDNKDLSGLANRVEAVYYYGAGCQNGELNKTVQTALSNVFKNAHVHVDHDIRAAIMATCQGKPGISCILGTGSNSAYFDGKDIHNRVSGLGYILGDEGSGSYFGKKLLSAFLYGQLPETINQELRAQGLSKETIINKVYMQPNANVYLASFMKFVSNHKDLPYF
ncbi:MAG: N-acetylglucosamine kinase, partial [Bacteroidetes bacterium]|nr:N-acetylglucosamine kinase [Bacteroidota bacterium]